MAKWQDRHKVIPAVYIIFRRGSEVLFLKRANTGYRDGEYSVPAGHFDGGESAIQAAIREAKEETGLSLTEKDLKLIFTLHRVADTGDHERIDLFFEVNDWQGEPYNAEPEKCSELHWFNTDDLPENLIPELQHLFKHLTDKRPYGDYGF